MDNFNKSSVKLLPIIENTDNRVTFYSEFDGGFEVGDKLYIAVNNTGITEYTALDSMANTGYTDYSIGYKLLKKDGNKLVLDIKYDLFSTYLNSLTPNTCFIGRVYLTNSEINRGIINGCLIKDTSTQPLSKSNIEWKQGILFDTIGAINNIDFNSKSSNTKLLLKTIINSNGKVESFYTYNNYGIGLSIINLSDNIFQLNNCNISAGVFNNCNIKGNSNTITGGELYDCFVGDTYVVNGGRLVNCEFESSDVSWINGKWSNNYTGDTAGNPFKPLTWEDGTWEDGYFPNSTTWLKGRFKDGVFNGLSWNDGEFDNGTLSGSTWLNGIFNSGIINGSIWENGIFNDGVIIDTRWKNGTLNNGSIYSTSTMMLWDDGIFNNGSMTNMEWITGIFNNGIISGCTWDDGKFYGGKFIGNSTWKTGKWYNGEFEDSIWNSGDFYNGIMKNSYFNYGSVYYGVFIDMDDYLGSKYIRDVIFYNGTLNNVLVRKGDFYNAIVNDSILGRSSALSIINWYNGSFNSGTFGNYSGGTQIWYDGKFYYGTFSGDEWVNGTFYTGDITTYINPKFKVNKPFKPYNEFGNFKKSTTKKRLPKHVR
jgi:hypothetical protein